MSILGRWATLTATVLTLAACGAGDGGAQTSPTVEPPEAGEPPAGDDAEAERAMERLVFDLANDERRERGLDPVEWDESLADLARDWSREMADRGSLEHQDGQVMLERAEGFVGVGENIFRATGPVPASTVHVGWMRSEGHRGNVLQPAFDRLGVGFVCTDDGEVWATQRFASTDARPAGTDEDPPPEEPIVADEDAGPTCPNVVGGP
jgi:uncharacterized protein YkwD